MQPILIYGSCSCSSKQFLSFRQQVYGYPIAPAKSQPHQDSEPTKFAFRFAVPRPSSDSICRGRIRTTNMRARARYGVGYLPLPVLCSANEHFIVSPLDPTATVNLSVSVAVPSGSNWRERFPQLRMPIPSTLIATAIVVALTILQYCVRNHIQWRRLHQQPLVRLSSERRKNEKIGDLAGTHHRLHQPANAQWQDSDSTSLETHFELTLHNGAIRTSTRTASSYF